MSQKLFQTIFDRMNIDRNERERSKSQIVALITLAETVSSIATNCEIDQAGVSASDEIQKSGKLAW